jgi:secondary thiamine-phosphate synthase enzyme
MKVIQDTLTLSTKGFNDIVDVTPQVREGLENAGLLEGQVTLFVPGATAGVTTIEYEPGLLKDLPEALDKVAPMNSGYHHDAAWGDGNGYAHVRAALIGPSLTVLFTRGRLILGTWQQIVVIDFDNRARQRKVSLQYIGE